MLQCYQNRNEMYCNTEFLNLVVLKCFSVNKVYRAKTVYNDSYLFLFMQFVSDITIYCFFRNYKFVRMFFYKH